MRGAILWLLWVGGGFLTGGIMFSQLIPRLMIKKDVYRESSDHNPGAANVFQLCRVPLGIVCLLLDLLKGFLPVYFAKNVLDISSPYFAFMIAAPVVGHAVGVFNHFHGGKCIAAAFGVLAGLIPETWMIALLAGLYIFFCLFVRDKPMQTRSLIVFLLFGLGSLIYLAATGRFSLGIGCGGIGAVAAYRHWKPGQTKSSLGKELLPCRKS